MSVHIHIVGQGLAGSALALRLHQLREAGAAISFTIEDDGHATSSSMVAAGMWNPLSFKKLHQSWNAEVLIPAADALYTSFERLLGVKFYHPTELLRVFANAAQSNEWTERSEHTAVAPFIAEAKDDVFEKNFTAPFGYGCIQQSGWMDLPAFLKATRTWLMQNNYFVTRAESREAEDFPMNTQPSIIVNCTGYRAAEIPGWEWLPIRPNKGQVLEVHLPGLSLERMVNFGKFMVPLGHEHYRMGATYEFHHPNPHPTEEVKSEILEALASVYKGDASVVAHKAGYRPTVPDRKPLVGLHPEDAQQAVFGGFGSKGVMLVPWSLHQFTALLLEGAPVDKTIDVGRYYAKA